MFVQEGKDCDAVMERKKGRAREREKERERERDRREGKKKREIRQSVTLDILESSK